MPFLRSYPSQPKAQVDFPAGFKKEPQPSKLSGFSPDQVNERFAPMASKHLPSGWSSKSNDAWVSRLKMRLKSGSVLAWNASKPCAVDSESTELEAGRVGGVAIAFVSEDMEVVLTRATLGFRLQQARLL